MKKRFFLVIMTLCVALASNAQYRRSNSYNYDYSFNKKTESTTPFLQDKFYVGASVSGLDLNYNGMSDLSVGFDCQAGYFVMDNIMILGNVGYKHVGGDDPTPDVISVGAGGRYYIEQNGIFLGLGVKYKHANHDYNDVMPGIELGYALFLNRTVCLEPCLFYEQSINDHSKYSNVGLRVGLGIYFER